MFTNFRATAQRLRFTLLSGGCGLFCLVLLGAGINHWFSWGVAAQWQSAKQPVAAQQVAQSINHGALDRQSQAPLPSWLWPTPLPFFGPRMSAFEANVEPIVTSAQTTQLYPFHPESGTLWQDLAVINFVDLDPTSVIKTFECGARAYDGHTGHDVNFGDFREMDIGQPFFAALDGTIVFIREDQPDRSRTCVYPNNVIVLNHGGGHHTLYFHLRTGSATAQTNVLTGQKLKVGDAVVAGQQLGLVGSAGCSSYPHLHFESQIGTQIVNNDVVSGQVFEPYGGACNPRPSNWVNQPQIPTNPYARDFYFSSTAPDYLTDQRVGSFVAVPAGQTKQIYALVQFVNRPSGTERFRFISPNGATPVDTSRPITPFSVGGAVYGPSVPIDTTGTWRFLLEWNGQTVVDAPFTVVASAAQLVNRPPNPVTVSLDPPAPQPGEVIFCRVNTNLYKRDPDYDIMRYRYQWRVNGTLVRDVTSSVLSDALWKGAAPLNATVSCTVTPSDGTASAAPAVASATITPKVGASIIVNSLADTQANDGQCTLREAIINANNDNQSGSTDCAAGNGAETISFSVTGTINLSSALPDINSDLTINGPGAAQLTVRRNTGGSYRVFNIPASKTASISGLTISNGAPPSGQNGGGILNNGVLTLTNCVITGNTATDAGTGTAFGGGVYNANALTVNNCQISGNTARNGGGLSSGAISTAAINNSTFSGNTVSTQGGGLYLLAANTTMTNCTISGNTATAGVGGIINIANAGQLGMLQMTNCTVTANNGTAAFGGGLLTWNNGGNVAVSSLKNTLLAANSSNFMRLGGATLTSLGGNFDSDGTSGFINGVNGDQVGTLLSPLDAGLSPLGNYGGPTPTHALSSSSSAVNAGLSIGAPTTDQRGIARPQGAAVDIGAFEANINLSPTTLPNGALNAAYNQTLTASGGTAPYTFAVIAGALPNGMSLNSSTGALSGTPTRGGAFTFTVKATDANGFAGIFNYTLLIGCPGVTITVTAPANNSSLVGQPFSATFVQTGVTGTATFSTTSKLPTGLTLSSGGVLSGTPTQTGVFPIVVNVNDSNGCLGVSPTYTLTISCLSFTVNSLNDTPDANPGNGLCADAAGNCTLRAAIMEANLITTACVTINFSVTGTLTLGTALPDIANSNLTLNGPGANQLTISGNNAVRVFSIGAGAFNVTFSGLTMANGKVSNSTADAKGGGILNASTGTVNINNCALTGNAVVNAANGTGEGGGILNSSTGAVNVTGSTLTGNSATGGVHGWGGGICNESAGVVTIINSTLSGNNAVATPGGQFRAQGGAMANRGNGTINVINCTITGNSSTDFGGGIVNGITAGNASTVVNLNNSIVAGNTAATGPDLYRGFTSLGFNLIGKGDGSSGLADGVNSDQVGSIAQPLDAKLAPLGNNGGPTQTHALLIGSPALDKGGPSVNTDQRGLPRPVDLLNIANAAGGNGSDIGAFEFQCATITLSALPNGVAGTPYSQTITPSGGATPYTLAVTTGILPPGLSLTGSTLAGTPTAGGTFNFTVRAIDANGCSGERAYTLVVTCPTITLAPATLPGGTVGAAYNQTVSASPAGSYTFAVTTGSLPAGLSLNSSTGAITGTPTTAGTSNFTITATGSGACTGSQTYSITIQSAAACPTVTSISPTSGAVGNVVTLTGTNLTSVTSVKFTSNVTANFTVISATQITALVPSGAVTGPITVSKTGCADLQTGTFTIVLPTCVPPPANLVAWYPGDTNANDIQSGNVGTLNGNAAIDTSTFRVGPGAFKLPGGASDFVSSPSSASLNVGTGDFSIDAWIRINAADKGVIRTIQDKRVNDIGYHLFLINGSLGIQLADSTGSTNFIEGVVDLADGAFHHVAATVARGSATGGTLYVDGVSVLTFDPTGRSGSLSNTADLRIGGHSNTPSSNFIGWIDEFELYTRALSQSEIQSMVNAGSAGKCKNNLTCPTVTSLNPTSGLVGSTVTITGTGFTSVSSVKFSNNVTATFTVVNDTTITATVPSGAASGPITISKTGCNNVQTASFTVTAASNCVPVSISSNLTSSPGGSLTVPITVGDLTGKGVTAYDFTLSFNSSVLKLSSTPTDAAGTLSSGFTVLPNTAVAGKISVSAFGTAPLTGAGTLLNLKFDIIGAVGVCSDLTWVSFTFNEGTPCATTSNGRLCIAGGAISGTVTYGTSTTTKNVPGVTLTAAGTPSATNTTNNTGAYNLPGLGGGPYTVTPTKSGDVGGISALDASQAAQHAAGIITLSANQIIAADASGNGVVSAFDASLIAQTAAGIANNGIAGTWKFVPANRSYPTLSGNQTNQDFVAILVGDVTGNWTSSLNTPSPHAVTASQSISTAIEAPSPIKVSLPQLSGEFGSIVTMPITVGDLTGRDVFAYDFTLNFDPAVLELQSSTIDAVNTLSSEFTIIANTATPGQVTISAFGTRALAGAGTLLNLSFKVIGAGGSATTLTWPDFTFNETVSGEAATQGSFVVELGGSALRTHTNVSAASFRSGNLAREEIVSAFGVNLAASTESASTLPLPTELAGTRVTITDSLGVTRSAPLFFVSPTQINYQIPAETAEGMATVTISRDRNAISIGLIHIAAIAPALFTVNANGTGLPAAVALHVDASGTQSYAAISHFDAATNRFIPLPINLGAESDQVFLILFGTGIRGHKGLDAVTCTMGGVPVETLYAGEAPGFTGLDQINLRIPRSLIGRGAVPLTLTINGQMANTVVVNIK